MVSNYSYFEKIISLDNLLLAWQEFIKGKKQRKDVQCFSLRFMEKIIILHQELKTKTYKHSFYESFKISDPKPRDIHKASVKDRLLHHAIYRILYPHFDKKFVNDSYSCRLNKGTHKAMNRFRKFGWKVSQNNTKTAWVLKCDIKKFFASIDQVILIKILKKHISDPDTIWFLERIIKSFDSGTIDKGLPLGNLTSQLLVNIYMNEFDQFVKHKLKIKYYIRYADDFVIFDRDKDKLLETIPKISDFLEENLKLSLHPNKLFLNTLTSGVDFLGWVHFPNHRVLRTGTKRRMMKKLRDAYRSETLESYVGLLNHGNAKKLQAEILDLLVYNKKTVN